MKWIFKNFGDWWSYTRASSVLMVKGFARLIYAIVFGIASVIVWLWVSAVRWVGRNPNVALGGFFVIMFMMWLFMFAKSRATKVGLEAQRDSIAWQYQNFKEVHGYE